MTIPPLDKYVAVDCEFVLVRQAQALAKIGMIDHTGSILLESYVFVHPENVVDWQSDTSGIRPGDLDGAPTFEQIQPKIKALLQDKILIGHAVFNDLAVCQHRHPYEDVRDTSLYYPLRKMMGIEREGEYPGLKKMYTKLFGGEEVQAEGFQVGAHDPVEDARAALRIFLTVREEYENALIRGEEVVSGVPRSYEKWYW